MNRENVACVFYDWEAFLGGAYDKEWEREYRYCHEIEDDEEVSEQELLNWIYHEDELVWDSFCAELKAVTMDEPIVCVADLGLWNGRARGWKMIGRNAIDCVYADEFDRPTFYIDKDRNFCAENCHHDGTNYLYFFTYSGDEDELDDLMSEYKVESLLEKGILKPMGKELIDRMPGCEWGDD